MLPQCLPRSEPLLNSEITPASEATAILAIVLRSLSLPQWNELIPEAQLQIIKEATFLINNSYLPESQKQCLEVHLQELDAHTTLVPYEQPAPLSSLKAYPLDEWRCA